MNYVVGDIQGCCDAFDRLLDEIGFSPSRDRIYVLGDLVNRGPCSRKVLERVAGLDDAAVALLGNHDLHLLGVASGARKAGRSDTLDDILDHKRAGQWLDWLGRQRLAVHAHGWLMVHAGVPPQWDAQETLARAREVEDLLAGPDRDGFLQSMYGNEPDRWSEGLSGAPRWRFIVNALTRMRFCTADGALDFHTKDGSREPPPGLMPWFDVPGRRTDGQPIAFGHWSTLGLVNRPDLLSTDTGCVWGGKLTAVRIDEGRRDVIQVACKQAQKPG